MTDTTETANQPTEEVLEQDFTSEQRERILNALAETFGEEMPPCAMCRQTQWRVARSLLAVPSSATPIGSIGRFYYLCIALVCQVCGNTVLMDTDKLGLHDMIGATFDSAAPRGNEVGS